MRKINRAVEIITSFFAKTPGDTGVSMQSIIKMLSNVLFFTILRFI